MDNLIIFDFDRTLVDLKVDWERMREKLRDYCRKCDIDFGQPETTFEGSKIAAEIFLERSGNREKTDIFYGDMTKIMKDEEMAAINIAEPMEGSKDFLKWIQTQKIKFVVFSFNHSECIIGAFKKFSFPLPEMVIGCDYSNYKFIKPDTRGIEKKLDIMKYGRAIVIGDSENDIKTAESLGLDVYILNLYEKNNMKISESKNTTCVASFSELKIILQNSFLK